MADRYWPFATNFSLGPDVSLRDEAEVDRAAEFAVSVENDPSATWAVHRSSRYSDGAVAKP
jgi:hypothetical protein